MKENRTGGAICAEGVSMNGNGSTYFDGFGDRNAVITGAGSGLGRAMALQLSRDGWKIGVADVDLEGGGETVEMIERAGGTASACHCDVTDAGEFEAAVDFFAERMGPATLAINNAGIAVAGITGDVLLLDWRKILDINVMGCVNGCHIFIPRMRDNGGGHIINVASAAGFVCLPEMAPYNVSKAAVIALSETLRSEVSPHNIGITVACPTFFNTHLCDNMVYSDDWQKGFTDLAFNNAKMTPDEIAAKILKAASHNRLYALPQFSAKFSRMTKRLSPTAHHAALCLVSRSGTARKVADGMARRGMV